MESHSRRVPLDKRKRTETSCDKCKSRKQKCDRIQGQTQCRYCQLHGIDCSTTQPRKKRVYGSVEGLGGRLALLESLVKGLLPEANLSSNDEMQQLGKALGIPLPSVEDDGHDSEQSPSKEEGEETTLPLLPDQQGQVQYIGPASSFGFHLKLRRLIGNYTNFEFSMFGRNAADPDVALAFPTISAPDRGRSPGVQRTLSNASSDCGSPSEAVREIDGAILELLIDAYFDVVHSDFPVLHEASFREAYENWTASDATSAANPVWLCGLLCVLLLARRVVSISIPEEAERKWWRHVQTLLPTVFFASNIFAVQALLLAALHLHNTSHRDACWNLTGTAVRIGFAIGLHRDDVKHAQSPLNRELRKQLWWTLYAFEQMQVSSYDRPSSIEHNFNFVSCPNERIVGVAGHCPQDYMTWSQRLIVLLGTACRVLNTAGNNSAPPDEAYSRPLSPAAGVLRDLIKWQKDLPSHLRLDVTATDSLAPSSRRPLLLLHAQFHYIVVLMSRSTLLRRATVLCTGSGESLPDGLLAISKTCIDSGRALGRLLLKLESIDKFNAFTWWDIFYTVASALILVLDISCCVKKGRQSAGRESKEILRELSNLMSRQLRDPKLPGSMAKWATIVVDVDATAEELMFLPAAPRGAPLAHILAPQPGAHKEVQIPQVESNQANGTGPTDLAMPFPYPSPSDGFSYEAPAPEREQASQFWAQLSFMDDLNGQSQDWSWDDIDAILRGSEN